MTTEKTPSVALKERKTLMVTEVSDPQTLDSGAIKLAFSGNDGLQTLPYFTFTQRLFPLIKAGATLECDVETKIRGVFTDRKVTQIYQDGVPVAVQRQPGSQFRAFRSPEERESIEQQVSVKAITDLLVAKIITLEHPLAQASLGWIEKRLLKGDGYSTEVEGSKAEAVAVAADTTDKKTQWSDIQPSLAALYNAKVAGWSTMVSILQTLYQLGANKEIRTIKEAFESLDEAGKTAFIAKVKAVKI